MTYAWDAIKSHIARTIGEAAGLDVKPGDLVAPPTPDLGDLAYGCFGISKVVKKSPADVAKDLATKIKADTDGIAAVSAAGPYLNITLVGAELAGRVVKDVENLKAAYGKSDDGKGKQLMLEYANQNTHKEVHVGHARPFLLGASVARLLQFAGWQVVTAGYHGDVGAHVAKCLWQLVRTEAAKIPRPKARKDSTNWAKASEDAWAGHVLATFEESMAKAVVDAVPKADRSGRFLGSVYTESTKALEAREEAKEEVSAVLKKLEAGDAAWMKLWKETRRWSIAEFSAIYEDLGMDIDKTYFESDMVKEGQAMVASLVKKGIAKESQGAVIVDLGDPSTNLGTGLGVLVIRRSDGTSLYSTKDLALAFRKVKEYPKLGRSIIMIDNRQSLYFKQLFRTLQLMGMTQALEMLGFEFVTLKSGAMSSREGNVVTLQSFREEVLAYAKQETRNRHAEWPNGKVEHVAWCLAMGGIKFGMLKQDSDKIIVFDLEKALSFDGATGPYIQYATTRLGSILKTAGWEAGKGTKAGDLEALEHPAEKRLALAIAEFPRAAKRAAEELRPGVMAQWCLDMATRSNEFYRDVPVIDAPLGVKQARLRLVASARSVLMLGLTLLGIPIPEEM
ncbi:MAG: arginine--tRNA ligase [Patescibacteria group bacterium]